MYTRILYIIIFLLTSKNIYADFCFKTYEKDTTEAKAIFIGKIVEINKDALLYRQEQKNLLTFKVITYYKGLFNYDNYVSVISPIDGCCNHPFIIDSNYIVFAYGNEDLFLWTNDCSNTAPVQAKKAFIKRLNNDFQKNIPSTEFPLAHKSAYSQTLQNKDQEISKLNNELSLKNRSTNQYKYWTKILIVIFLLSNLIWVLYFKSK